MIEALLAISLIMNTVNYFQSKPVKKLNERVETNRYWIHSYDYENKIQHCEMRAAMCLLDEQDNISDDTCKWYEEQCVIKAYKEYKRVK